MGIERPVPLAAAVDELDFTSDIQRHLVNNSIASRYVVGMQVHVAWCCHLLWSLKGNGEDPVVEFEGEW